MNILLRQVFSLIEGINLKKIFKKNELKIVLTIFVFFLLVLLLPNNKFFFIWSALFFSFLLLFSNSIEEVLIFLFWPFFIFETGQAYTKTVIPREVLDSNIYWNGRSLLFVFSPFFILTITMLIILILSFFSKRFKFSISKTVLFYLLSFLFALFGVSKSILFNFSFLNYFIAFSFILWIIFTSSYISSNEKKKREFIYVILFWIFFFLLNMEFLVVIFQFFKHDVLGLLVEKAIAIPSFGFGSDEFSAFRPVGFQYHANSLANWFLSLFFIFPLFFSVLEKRFKTPVLKRIYFLIYIELLAVIFSTLSRSAYLALFVLLGSLFLFANNFLRSILKDTLLYLDKIKIILLILSLFLFKYIPERIIRTSYSFVEGGGAKTRFLQFRDAFNLIKMNPYFGVGIGLFIPAMWYFIPGGEITKFPENVHNGFLLFIAERGLISFIFSFLAISFLFKKLLDSNYHKNLKLILSFGILSNFLMMFFQPFDNMLSANIMLAEIFLLGGNSNEKK